MIALTWSGGSRPALFLMGGDVVLGIVLHLWPTTPLATFSGEYERGKLRWLRVYPVILLMLVEQEGGVS